MGNLSEIQNLKIAAKFLDVKSLLFISNEHAPAFSASSPKLMKRSLEKPI